MVLSEINCFSGTIPDTVCVASNLSVIVFDGASSAKACDVRLPKGLQEVFEVVLSKMSLLGSIPTCVWSMPLLTTLHAAGNGLRGSLGELYQVIFRLSDINLDSNWLSVSISTSWQQTSGQFVTIDLSSIKLTPGYTFKQCCQCSQFDKVNLTVNRLSGSSISSILATAQHVDLLEGNLFQCNHGNKQTTARSE